MEATLYNQAGEQIGSLELNEYIFGVTPNIPLMHQYVVMQQANAHGIAAWELGRLVPGSGKVRFDGVVA